MTKKIEKIQKDIDCITDVICDICDKSCLDEGKMNFEFAHLSATWGYYSGKDGTRWSCDICSNCADKIRNFVEQSGGKIEIE